MIAHYSKPFQPTFGKDDVGTTWAWGWGVGGTGPDLQRADLGRAETFGWLTEWTGPGVELAYSCCPRIGLTDSRHVKGS